jgi:25S rRNA (cytosine2278-C5)-methyltransferase
MSRQYLNAAKVVKAVLSGESLTRYCSKHKVGKEEYALTCETLKFNEVITDLLRESGTDAQTLDVDEFVLRVMIYELFFGKKKIQGGGAVKRVIMSNFALFEKVLLEELIRKGKTSYVHLQSDIILSSSNLPKYVRINVIKMQVASGIDEIRKKFPNAEADPEIPSLIKIPPPYGGIADMNSVNTGQMIIQDKASCFPSQILFDEWSESGRRGHFIDACAAPGNKTSHLSALSWDSKTEAFSSMVFAFDRNITRCELLRSRMEQAGASNVIASCENFLDVDTSLEKYSMVTAALVDPSCSGSGVVRSLERVIERTRQPSDDQQTDERLSKLSKFQISAISKAFQFPFIRTVVYSTCSIHQVWKQLLPHLT